MGGKISFIPFDCPTFQLSRILFQGHFVAKPYYVVVTVVSVVVRKASEGWGKEGEGLENEHSV